MVIIAIPQDGPCESSQSSASLKQPQNHEESSQIGWNFNHHDRSTPGHPRLPSQIQTVTDMPSVNHLYLQTATGKPRRICQLIRRSLALGKVVAMSGASPVSKILTATHYTPSKQPVNMVREYVQNYCSDEGSALHLLLIETF